MIALLATEGGGTVNAGFRHKLLRAARAWQDQGLITTEQFQRISSRYPPRRTLNVTSLIYLFAALLVGLGAVLLVAANWAHIARSIRLAIVCLLIISAYAGGCRALVHQRNPHLGVGLLFLGTLLFGAGIWLVGQMYHLVYYDATGFLYWAAGTAAVALLVGSPFIFAASLVELTIFGIASATRYATPWLYYPSFLVLAVPFMVRWTSLRTLSMGLASLSLTTLVILLQAGFGSPALVLFGLLLLSSLHLVPRRLSDIHDIVTTYATGFGFAGAFGVVSGAYYSPDLAWVAPACLVLLALFFARVLFQGQGWAGLAPVLVFIPYFYLSSLSDFPASYVTLAGLAVFSVGLLLAGGSRGRLYQVNLGSLYLLLTTLFAYVHLAQEFISGGFLFISSGMLLFLLGWFLDRNRRRLIGRTGGVKTS